MSASQLLTKKVNWLSLIAFAPINLAFVIYCRFAIPSRIKELLTFVFDHSRCSLSTILLQIDSIVFSCPKVLFARNIVHPVKRFLLDYMNIVICLGNGPALSWDGLVGEQKNIFLLVKRRLFHCTESFLYYTCR